MAKVIAFSLWGNDPKYCVGAVRNAEIAAELFPDWECWFYVAEDVSMETAGKLANLDNVVLLDMPQSMSGWKGMFARFQPAGLPYVEAMISRDCDSRLSHREKAAVDAWLESGKGFHIMRDHPWHGSSILGGMWGVKCGILPDMENLIGGWDQEDRWQTDQDFLNTAIYPRIVDNCMVHASFCRMESHATDFPVPRSGTEFVGQVFDEKEHTVAEHVQALAQAL